MKCTVKGKLRLRSHNTRYCLIEVVTKAGFTVYVWLISRERERERERDDFAIFSSPCQRQCDLLPSLGIRRLSSINFSHFNLLL